MVNKRATTQDISHLPLFVYLFQIKERQTPYIKTLAVIHMKLYIVFIVAILTSCRSVELAKPISYFFPKSVTFGASLPQVSNDLGIDTAKYEKIFPYGHIKGR